MNKSSIAPFMALLTAMMLWGSSFVAFKYVVMVFDPVVVVFARMVLADRGTLVWVSVAILDPAPSTVPDVAIDVCVKNSKGSVLHDAIHNAG